MPSAPVIESQNRKVSQKLLSWKGPLRIIESNSSSCTGPFPRITPWARECCSNTVNSVRLVLGTPSLGSPFQCSSIHRKGRSLIFLDSFSSLKCGWNLPYCKSHVKKVKTSPHKTGVYAHSKPKESNKWQSKSKVAGLLDRNEVKKIIWMSVSWFKNTPKT